MRSKVPYILTNWHAFTITREKEIRNNKNTQNSKKYKQDVARIAKKKIMIYMYINTTINHIIHQKMYQECSGYSDQATPTKQYHITNQQTQG